MRLYPTNRPETPAASHKNTRETGFIENWSNALGLSITEDLPITSRLLPSVAKSSRNQKLYDYRERGLIPQSAFDFYGGDSDGLAYYARNDLGLEDIPTQEEFDLQQQSEYSNYREMSGRVSAQQTKLGFAGEMAGRMHAMALDPIYAASFLTGYGSATTIGQAALRVGLMESGIEILAQPLKIAWKDEIGADYGATQALTEIAFAGLGGAALAAGGKALGKVLTPKDLTVADGIKVFEKLAKDNPELDPVLNTLRHADPEDNLGKVMADDEAVDTRTATGRGINTDPKEGVDIKASEFETKAEEIFQKRQLSPDKKLKEDTLDYLQEGVPRGTSKKTVDTRHPLVKEADDMVVKADENIKIMEDCF